MLPVKRKWGWYLTLLDYKHFKVKLLWFKKDAFCSLQYHNLRNELWCFLYGTGWFNWTWPIVPETFKARENYRVKSGDVKNVLIKQEHMYRAEKYSLILEIQYGELCDEADIVRI